MDIAIVDDEVEVRRELEQELRRYFSAYYPQLLPQLSFRKFSCAEDFLPLMPQQEFALIFLDIYMDKLTGLDAARRLRRFGVDTPIVFLTTSVEHQLDGYSVFAAGYLMKPLSANIESLIHVLDHCLPSIVARNQQLTVQIGPRPVNIPFHRILYIDCNNNRTVIIHLVEEQILTSSTYRDCLEQLQLDKRFMECYHHLLVNMAYINRVDEDTFQLKNGESIPISRRKRREVKQEYMHYLTTNLCENY